MLDREKLAALERTVDELWTWIAKVYGVDADSAENVLDEQINLMENGYDAMADDLNKYVDEYDSMKRLYAEMRGIAA